MPEADPMELALANIGRDVASDYEQNYRGLNDRLLTMSAVDRSNQAAGRSNVDAQMAVSNQMDNAVARGVTSGGLGSGAGISLVNAGATGGALQSAGAAGFGAGQQERVNRVSGAVNAVQSGQDTAAQGLRTAAGISSRDALEDYNNAQAMKAIRQQGIAQTISAVGQAEMARRSLGDVTTDRAPQLSFPSFRFTSAPARYNNNLGAPIDQMYLGNPTRSTA